MEKHNERLLGQPLLSTVKKSLAWSAVEQLGLSALNFAISVVMARLLEPSDFGLMGMLALFMGVAGVFVDFGFSSALIQRKVLTADDETSVFAFNIIAGAGFAVLLCLLAPMVARFYDQPILFPLLCVNSLSMVISTLGGVQSTLFIRDMHFDRVAQIGLATTILSGATGVSMAVLGFGVWSLLGVSISASISRTALCWKLSTWRPRGHICRQSIRSMLGYSSNLLGCQLIGILFQNIYPVIIGKVYSAEDVGYYNRANNLRMMPVGLLSGIVNRVAFPLFSKHQDDKQELLKRMRQIIRSILFLSIMGLGFMALTADPLIPLLFTDKWRPAIPLLRILCYAAAFYPVSVTYLMALQAQGHTNLNLRLEVIKVVIAVLTAAAVYPYGVKALAWSMVALAATAYFLNAWYNVKLLGYRWQMQAVDILPAFFLAASSGWAAWWVCARFSAPPLLVLCLQSATFFVLCGTGLFLFRRTFFLDIFSILELPRIGQGKH